MKRWGVGRGEEIASQSFPAPWVGVTALLANPRRLPPSRRCLGVGAGARARARAHVSAPSPASPAPPRAPGLRGCVLGPRPCLAPRLCSRTGRQQSRRRPCLLPGPCRQEWAEEALADSSGNPQKERCDGVSGPPGNRLFRAQFRAAGALGVRATEPTPQAQSVQRSRTLKTGVSSVQKRRGACASRLPGRFALWKLRLGRWQILECDLFVASASSVTHSVQGCAALPA